jgi:hypothetical protein
MNFPNFIEVFKFFSENGKEYNYVEVIKFDLTDMILKTTKKIHVDQRFFGCVVNNFGTKFFDTVIKKQFTYNSFYRSFEGCEDGPICDFMIFNTFQLCQVS